ncbi:MAG: hypothetical protein D6720_06365 [Gammaproteobacteria bacterium]|nr:MAG: hypothetical protein D6720_06365 [Gammaproteobacteria bacterium]
MRDNDPRHPDCRHKSLFHPDCLELLLHRFGHEHISSLRQLLQLTRLAETVAPRVEDRAPRC